MKLFFRITGNEGLNLFCYNEARPSNNNDGGPLKVEHIKGAQETDKNIQEALARFNARFQGNNFDTVLQYLDEIDEGELTAKDIDNLENYATQIEALLVENSTPATRCRAVAEALVEDFELYPTETQQAVVSALVDLEEETESSITDLLNDEPDWVREECMIWIGNAEREVRKDEGVTEYEAGVDENESVVTEGRAVVTEGRAVVTEGRAEDAEYKAATEIGEQDKQLKDKEIKEMLNSLSENLTFSQIEEALTEAQNLSEPDSLTRQLKRVQTDLSSVSAIATPQNPQEAAELRSIIQSTPVTWKAPSPTVRYAQILTAIDAGNLSDDTKRRAREALGINLSPSPTVSTGSDMQDALRDGRGTERVPTGRTETVEEPPGSGNFVEKPIYEDKNIPYDADHPLEVREGVSAYPAENGDYIMTAQLPNGRVLRFNVGSADVSGEDVGQKINAAIVSYVFSQKGALNTHQQGLVASQGGQIIDINDVAFGQASQFAQNVMQYFVGGTTGMDGEIMDSSNIRKIDRIAQWLGAEKGDFFGGEDGGHGSNEFSPNAPYLTQLGLINENGSIGDTENFQIVGSYVQGKIGTGNPDYQAVLDHYQKIKGVSEETE